MTTMESIIESGLTIDQAIKAFERKIQIQKSILNHCVNNGAMRVYKTIRTYELIIEDLKAILA